MIRQCSSAPPARNWLARRGPSSAFECENFHRCSRIGVALSTVTAIRQGVGVVLNKRQLAQQLARSSRWIELKVGEGMPSIPPTARYPHRRFVLAEVEAWLNGGRARRATTAERVAALEVDVASLRRMIDELRVAQ
jgi:hypothetical protein